MKLRLVEAVISGAMAVLLFITGLVVEVNSLLAAKYQVVERLTFTQTAWATGSVIATTYDVVGCFVGFALWCSAGVYAISNGLMQAARRYETVPLAARAPASAPV